MTRLCGVALGVVGFGLVAAGGCNGNGGAAPDAGAARAGAVGAGAGGSAAGGGASVVDAALGADAADGSTCSPAPPPGPTWAELPAPPPEVVGLTVTDAWPAGGDDFFFAGSFPQSSPDGGTAAGPGWAVLRWTHGCWSVELSRRPGSEAPPRIAGMSAADVWLTTGDTIYHRDAQGWSVQDDAWRAAITPIPTSDPWLTDVQPLTTDEVWFATRDAIVRLRNGQWQSWKLTDGVPNEPGSITRLFTRLWVGGADDVWAAGGSDAVGTTMDPASVYHFDGTSWSIHYVGTFDVNDLWPAAAPGQFWLAQPISSNNPQNPIYFFDGSTASPTAISGWPAAAGIASLWARSPTDVWGAGQDVAHNDGSGWTKVSGTPDAVLDPHHAGSDSLVTGDATTTWLVGRGPRFFRQAAPAAP